MAEENSSSGEKWDGNAPCGFLQISGFIIIIIIIHAFYSTFCRVEAVLLAVASIFQISPNQTSFVFCLVVIFSCLLETA